MRTVSEIQLQILERLNDYRFLTVAQMIEIGISSSKHTLSRNIRALRDGGGKRAFIDYVDFGTFPTIGRLSRIHYITKKGAKLLAEALQIDSSEINHPKGIKLFTRDYFHRVQTVDLHISARKFAERYKLDFEFFHTYYEHTGANNSKNPNQPKRQALTKIPLKDSYFIPDCIFKMIDPKGEPWLFTGEIYRGHTTKRTQQQLIKHLEALEHASINKVYNYPRSVRILVVCEQEGAMIALQKRVKNDPLFKHSEAYFLFATLATIKADFATQWQDYSGNFRNLFVV